MDNFIVRRTAGFVLLLPLVVWGWGGGGACSWVMWVFFWGAFF